MPSLAICGDLNTNGKWRHIDSICADAHATFWRGQVILPPTYVARTLPGAGGVWPAKFVSHKRSLLTSWGPEGQIKTRIERHKLKSFAISGHHKWQTGRKQLFILN